MNVKDACDAIERIGNQYSVKRVLEGYIDSLDLTDLTELVSSYVDGDSDRESRFWGWVFYELKDKFATEEETENAIYMEVKR